MPITKTIMYSIPLKARVDMDLASFRKRMKTLGADYVNTVVVC